MSNPLNSGIAVIRLAAAPQLISRDGKPNADGSKSVSVTGYADHNYPSRSGEYGSDKLSFRAYVQAKTEGLGIFGSMEQGSVWTVNYRLRNNDHEENGTMVYDQYAEITDVAPVVWRPANARGNAQSAPAQGQQAPAAQGESPFAQGGQAPAPSFAQPSF